jgi:radical SAM protein with 4Fe4S-binding SPASM domain
MPKDKQKFYFQQDLLLRKEHFGVLALLGDGRRYLFDKNYFDYLKYLYKRHLGAGKGDLSDDNGKVFLNYLVGKNIIGKKDKQAKVRFIENNFVSRDCLSFPRTIYWECTRKCNFNCIHCYSSSGSKVSGKELNIKQVKSFIDELSAKGAEFLSIGGGEPLLYPYLIEVVKYAVNKSVSVEISTNASLVTDKIIVQLKKAGLKFIQVSLDGACEKTYAQIRRGGKFSTTVKNIKKLSEYFTVSTCMVVNKLNYREIEEVIDLTIKSGAKFFRIIPFMAVGRAAEMPGLQLEKKDFISIYKTIIRKRTEVKGKIFIQLNENLVMPEQKNIGWMPEEHYGCSAGRSTCGIDSSGNVYPCSYMVFDELNCGNIKNQSLSEIWNDSKVMKKIRKISSLKGKCSQCEHLSICRGGCRAAAYLKHHNLRDSDYLCSIK